MLYLALEQALRERITYYVGHSAVVLSVAQNFLESGRVSEDVNINVRFSGSNYSTQNDGANIASLRVVDASFEVITYYKQMQMGGHAFALTLAGGIENNIKGFIPDLTRFLGSNVNALPQFQTGFEPQGTDFALLDDNSIFAYTTSFRIRLILPQCELSPYPCPLDFDIISIKDTLPCKRCLRTQVGNNIGLAEYNGPCFDGTPIFVLDQEKCPTRPGDILDINLVEQVDTDLYRITLVYTPQEAISYDPQQGVLIDESKQITSALDRYYYHPSGTLPAECIDFSVIFRVHTDESPVTNDVRDATFVGEVKYNWLI